MQTTDLVHTHFIALGRVPVEDGPNKADHPGSRESVDTLAEEDVGVSFGGMVPDPIVETDLIARIEAADSL